MAVKQKQGPQLQSDDRRELEDFRRRFERDEGELSSLRGHCDRLAASEASYHNVLDELRTSLADTRDTLHNVGAQAAACEARQSSLESGLPLADFQRCRTDLDAVRSSLELITAQLNTHEYQTSVASNDLKELRSRQDLLEQQVRADIKSAEKKIDDSFDRQWKLPKAFLTFLGVVAGLYLAGTAVREYFTFTDIRATAKRLDDKAGSIEKTILDKVNEQLTPQLARMQENAAQAHKDAAAVHTLVTNHTAIAGAVNTALSSTNLGHQQLVYEHNPHQALRYAQAALEALDDRIGQPGLSDRSLDSVRASVLILQAQALMEIGDHAAVDKIAEKLIHLREKSSEGYHYQGLSLLLKASDEQDDKLRRTTSEEAIDSLKKALDRSERRGHPDLLFLSIAEFDNDHFQACLDLATEFVRDKTTEGAERANRLGPNVRAQLALAKAWSNLAEFKLGRKFMSDHHPEDLSSAAIRPEEGRVLEAMLYRIILRNDCSQEKQGDAARICREVRAYCQDLLGTVQHCCGHTPPTLVMPGATQEPANAPAGSKRKSGSGT